MPRTIEIDPITIGAERGTNANGDPRGRVYFTVTEADLERVERLMESDEDMRVRLVLEQEGDGGGW